MPRDSIGGGMSAAYLVMGLAAPLTAVLINRFRTSLTLFFDTLLFALSALLLGIVVNGPLGFTTDFGVIAGMGLSIRGLLPLQTIVANWFVRRQAPGMAVMLSAGGVGWTARLLPVQLSD